MTPLPADLPPALLWVLYIGAAASATAATWRYLIAPLSHAVELLRSLDKRLALIEKVALGTTETVARNSAEIKRMVQRNRDEVVAVHESLSGEIAEGLRASNGE